MVCHIHHDICQKHGLILFPLSVGRALIVLLSHDGGLIRLMIECVDAVCLALINDPTLKEEVVAPLERNYLLLLVRVEGRIVLLLLLLLILLLLLLLLLLLFGGSVGDLVCPRISDHVV